MSNCIKYLYMFVKLFEILYLYLKNVDIYLKMFEIFIHVFETV